MVHAFLGGCGGAIFGLLMSWNGRWPAWSILAIVPFVAFVAGLMEWQLDDYDEEEEQPQ